MSDVKEPITFSRSMTLDKRNGDFAYLRKNAYPSRYPGLYPSGDFFQQTPAPFAHGYVIKDMIGSQSTVKRIKVFTEYSGNIRIYDLGSGTLQATITGKTFECGVDGRDDVHFCLSDAHIYSIGALSNTVTDLGANPGGMPDVAANDGLYYWWISPYEITKQLGSATPTIAFNDLGGISPQFVDFLNDEMVIFAQDGPDIIVLFWDKSDPDLFNKRIVIPNSNLIAGGVVNGRLMLVKGVGNSANPMERDGEIVVCGYDGEKFARLNSIKGGSRTLTSPARTSVDTGSEVMLFSIANNRDDHNDDLYRNYIYKVEDDGSIEVQTLPDSGFGTADIVRIFYYFIAYSQPGDAFVGPLIYINQQDSNEYFVSENYTTTEYITNFFGTPYNLHKLDGFMVAFEKMFEETVGSTRGETADIYYRVSERDPWTLLGNITSLKVKDNVNKRRDQSVEYPEDFVGLPEQRYAFTKMPDGTTLPEFNEIQYKFVLQQGFAVIGAWHTYSYHSRNTLN